MDETTEPLRQEFPTMNLRWKDSAHQVLQQQWQIVLKYPNGVVEDGYEWREVRTQP